MKKTSLARSTSYWLLLVLSLASVVIGGWLVWSNTTTMLTTILDGTATNVEVYVGQAWITSGAALLAAGIVGIFLSLVLSAVKGLVPSATPALVDPIDRTTEGTDISAPEPVEGAATRTDTETEAAVTGAEVETESADQNGSSGSTATATNSSVR